MSINLQLKENFLIHSLNFLSDQYNFRFYKKNLIIILIIIIVLKLNKNVIILTILAAKIVLKFFSFRK